MTLSKAKANCQHVVDDFSRSKLSAENYCQQKNISVDDLRHYLLESQSHKVREDKNTQQQFIPLKIKRTSHVAPEHTDSINAPLQKNDFARLRLLNDGVLELPLSMGGKKMRQLLNSLGFLSC